MSYEIALNRHPQAQVHTFNAPFVFETPYMGKTETIPVLEVGYEEWGDRAHPTILVCHALSGNTHATDPGHPDDYRRSWWGAMVGPGKAIDTTRYHVMCINTLGGCGGTSGPASINPDSGTPYGLHFPIVTIEDMVRSQKMLLDALGIERLHAVIGGSMGGFQVLVWGVLFPEMVERLIVVASSAYSNQFMIMTNRAQIDAIQMDAHYNNGLYHTTGKSPTAGLAIARMIGFTTFISPKMMEKKFQKYHRSRREPYSDAQFHQQMFHEAESYLHKVSEQFTRDFDANSMLYLLQTWSHFDMAVRYGSLAHAMERVQAKVMLIAATGDNLFPPYLTRDIHRALRVHHKPVQFSLIDEEYGHDFFLIPNIIVRKLTPAIRSFLDG
ncbi:MAG: homoserine O-acetyltransferase [Candidatus Lambdaproteobacteria bacterium]|nr:homoserine O-acetyltransferase [Candidatus Lambdaproteobacteria bacterium]